MSLDPVARRRWNRVNGTTLLGHALARVTRSSRSAGPLGTVIAERYPLRLPDAACFVIGDVIFCKGTAEWLTSLAMRGVLVHEVRHTYQYARWGPLFWPLYFAGSAWSYLITGNFGARNAFERNAGLADGGYSEAPVRPVFRTLISRF
jgi:hypothetical protein